MHRLLQGSETTALQYFVLIFGNTLPPGCAESQRSIPAGQLSVVIELSLLLLEFGVLRMMQYTTDPMRQLCRE